MSTPAANCSRRSSSIVCGVGSMTSIRRLCVRISNCSRESLSINGERITVHVLRSVGSGIGPRTSAPVRPAVSMIRRAASSSTRWSYAFRRILIRCVGDCRRGRAGARRAEASNEAWRGGRVRACAMGYLTMFVTTPAPTVTPPSRMAKLTPSSSAIGWCRRTVISTLSPGTTISVPAGNSISPVTSVVRM